MNTMLNVLQLLSNLPTNDLSMEKVNFARLNSKLGHVNSRISFLLDCRSLQLTPAFIQHKTSKLNYEPQAPLASKVARLKHSMLNEEIKSAFRTKAYLQRGLDRSADILRGDPGQWPWLQEHCRLIFAEELRTGQERLLKKLGSLSLQQHGNRLNYGKTRTYKHINWLVQSVLRCVTVPEAQHLCARPVITPDTGSSSGHWSRTPAPATSPPPTCSASPVNGTSPTGNTSRSTFMIWLTKAGGRLLDALRVYSRTIGLWVQTMAPRWFSAAMVNNHDVCFLQPSVTTKTAPVSPPASADDTTSPDSFIASPPTTTQPRLVNLSQHSLDPGTEDILKKGPNFAISQTVGPYILNVVEVGIERAFYALKWATHIEDRKSNSSSTSNDGHDGALDSASDAATSTQSVSVPHPRPTFRDSDVQQPPDVDPAAERKLEGLKSKIMKLYTRHKTQEQPNVSSSVRRNLTHLKADQDLVIKQSDKCKSFVLLDKNDYLQKAQSITDSYQKIDKNPTRSLEEETKDLMRNTLQNKIPQDHLKRLLPQHARTAEFYGLPKTHKTDNPLRPIVAACGDPLDKLSWFLQLILGQLLQFVPTHLPNSDVFLARLREAFPVRLPENSIVFTMDVRNLYGSIPIQEGIDSVMTLIRDNVAKLDLFGLSLTDFHKLLSHVLTNNYLRFGQAYFKQTTGIAMGNRIAPPVAISFMHILESTFLSSLHLRPDFLTRYIDDYCGIWSHGAQQLEVFFEKFNSFNPAIKLTIDQTGETSEIPFLDILLTVRSNGTYTTELYIKPMTAPIVMHFHSAHPMATKKATLKSQIRRAMKVSSDQQARCRSLNKIVDLFVTNEYPISLINQSIKHCLRPTSRKQPRNRANQCYMKLPYIDEVLSRRVTAAIRAAKAPITVCWTNPNTLKKKLVSSALTPPPCPSGNKRCHTCDNGLKGHCTTRMTVYQITCLACQIEGVEATYIGQTRRPIRARFNEHLGDARRRKLDTGLGDHTVDYHTNMDNSQVNRNYHVEILTTKEHEAELRICESVYIREHNPSMNTQARSWRLTKHVI